MTDLKRMDVHEALDKVRSEKDRLEEEVRTKTDLYNNLKKSQHELVTKFQESKLQYEKQTKELNAKSEEMISKLEEKLRDVEDQLKWKNEQFQHLEEAHERLQYSFQSSKTEWEKEKALLLEEINSIQRSLDSQIRMSETLQTQLKICNQALAHEESTRKLLEVEVSEYKSRFDDVFMECNEAKVTIEKLSHKRDEEVAELRDSLATKDSLSKEMGYKFVQLEQENQDLTTSLKEFQESQIVKCGSYNISQSLKKLQKKHQDLEQLYKKCNENLKEKEVEWKCQMEKSKKEMDKYVSRLRFQDEKVKQLQEELGNFQIQNHKDGLFDDLSDKVVELEKENQSFSCKVNEQNEKIVDLQQEVVLLKKLVTERTKKIEAQKQDGEKYFKIIKDKESNIENMVFGFEQEKKSLLQVIEEKNKKIEELIEKMTNAFKISEEKQIENDVIHHALEKKEIEVSDLCEKMKLKDESLFQASKNVEELQGLLEIKKLEKEIQIDDMNKALHKMQIEVSDLCEKMKLKDELLLQASQHVKELEVLLDIKKLEIEKMKEQLREELENVQIQNHKDCLFDDLSDKVVELEKENQSFLCKVNEQNEKIVDLQKEVVLLENLVTERTKTIEAQKQDKESKIENLLIGFEKDKKSLLEVIEEKNKKIEELTENMTSALKISEEKQIENDVLHHALLKMKTEVYDLCEKIKMKDGSLLQASKDVEELQGLLEIKKLEKQIEIDDMNKSLHKMETEVYDLCEKIKMKDESLFQASKHVEELQGLLELKKLEKEIEIDNMNKALHKMEIEVSDLCEKMKLKDQSLLQASKHVKELEVLLEIKKLEIEKMNEQFGDDKRQLEVEKQGLREDITKLLSDREDLLVQMETMSEKMCEFSEDDELLTGMLDNMLKKCTLVD